MVTATDVPIVKPDIVFLEELLDEVVAGNLRVPCFQRPFVWKPSDMLDLFDSLYKSYPIGSLLLWESVAPITSLDKVGPLSVPESSARPISYILDGQQRLATLLGGLRLPKDVPLDTEQKHWQWWIWFDLEESSFSHVSNAKPEPSLLPLRHVTKTVDFLNEARKIQERYAADPDKANAFIAKAEQLAQKLKSYKVAVIRIKGGGLAEAVEIFSRLNAKGTRVTPDQMVSALTYREGESEKNLAAQIDEILEKLSEYYFGKIRRMTVFRAIVAAADRDIHKSEWEELAKKLGDDLPQASETAKEALWRAARFLHQEIGIPSDKLLPYNNQILLLSEFFHRCPHPREQQQRMLMQWFWVSSLSGWLASVNTTQVNNILQEMRMLAEDENTKLKVMPLDYPVKPFPGNYDMRNARVRALFIFMFSLKPLDLKTGELLDTDHIMRELDNRGFVSVFYRPEREFAANPANRILVERQPGQSVRQRLLDISEPILDKVLQSHGIPVEAYEALQEDDENRFIRLRAEHLARLEREFMERIGVTPPKGGKFVDADVDTDDD